MRNVLVVVNPNAGTMSPRRREVIVKALASDMKVEVAETERRDHATDLTRDAVESGFDAVVAVGGDGTVNEAAQSLIGTETALGIIPAGSTNVMARALGIPRDAVEATAYVSQLLVSGQPRTINVGKMGHRHFLFCAGMGLDAEVVRRVEEDPDGKRRRGEWLFLGHALRTALTEYCGQPPKMRLSVDGGEPRDVLLAVCGNARPFTYFKSLPVDACPEARLDAGLDFLGFTSMRRTAIPRLARALLFTGKHISWPNALYLHDARKASFRADDPLPVQVDGDYIGHMQMADVELVPEGLRLLA